MFHPGKVALKADFNNKIILMRNCPLSVSKIISWSMLLCVSKRVGAERWFLNEQFSSSHEADMKYAWDTVCKVSNFAQLEERACSRLLHLLRNEGEISDEHTSTKTQQLCESSFLWGANLPDQHLSMWRLVQIFRFISGTQAGKQKLLALDKRNCETGILLKMYLLFVKTSYLWSVGVTHCTFNALLVFFIYPIYKVILVV